MLDKIQPTRLRGLHVESGRVFYRKTLPGESVGKLYYRQGLTEKETLLFDPLNFIPGTKLTLTDFAPSYDGKRVALSYSRLGAEVSTIRIIDVEGKKMLSDSIYPTRGIDGWTFDNAAILYTSLTSGDAKNPLAFLNSKTRLHPVGRSGSSQGKEGDQDFFSNAAYPGLHIKPGVYPYTVLDEFSPNYIFSGEGTVEPEITMYYAPMTRFTSTIDWKVLCNRSDSLVKGIEFVGNQVFAISHAYNWYPDHIKGADTVSNNTKKDFGLDFKSPNLNWNLDIETFEMLPLAAGKKFALNFYDACLDPPAYVLYQVTGDEVLTLYGNKTVDCWKLITQGEHDRKPYSETYWISKNDPQFLKEEDDFGGIFRFKIRMPDNSPNLLTRFTN